MFGLIALRARRHRLLWSLPDIRATAHPADVAAVTRYSIVQTARRYGSSALQRAPDPLHHQRPRGLVELELGHGGSTSTPVGRLSLDDDRLKSGTAGGPRVQSASMPSGIRIEASDPWSGEDGSYPVGGEIAFRASRRHKD